MSNEAQALAESSHFTEQEINGPLRARFMQLPQDESGHASLDDVCSMPEVAMYPSLKRIVNMRSADKDGRISFADFVRAMSTLSGRASMAEKLQDAFLLYDLREDEFISPAELFNVFRLLTGQQHSDEGLQQIVDSFLVRYRGGMSYNDFKQMFAVSDLSKLTLNL